MKSNNPLKAGIINMALTFLFLLLLITFSKLESVALIIITIFVALLATFSSLRGILLSMKSVKNRNISIVVFLFSMLLNSIFPLILALLLMANLIDIMKLFD